MINGIGAYIEALVFCSNEPLSGSEIAEVLNELYGYTPKEDELNSALNAIMAKYADESFAFELVKSGGGYQFLTKPAFQHAVSVLLKNKSKRKLSTSALETLAIITYKQPITKAEIEAIRGVNCDYAIQKLLEKDLISIAGKADQLGRPLLYKTGKKFMDYFGINELSQLPELKDIPQDDNAIGQGQE